ncbi:MAG: hypothetical protein IPL32_08275 [Chloracidobacterium sp.]|nr:hypothetical protein [Chloracidobacterium sp.]
MNITIPFRYVLASLLVFAITFHGLIIKAQTNSLKTEEPVSYEQILDFLYAEYFVGRGSGYGIHIRYTPERGNELQVTIMETDDGRSEVRTFVPVKESIREQFYNYLERHPKATFEEITSNIRVKKELIPLSATEIRDLRKEILNIIRKSVNMEKETLPRPSKEMSIFLHPDGYEMSFYGLANINLSGASPQDSPEPPFITWMKKKRPVFEKWATTAPSK